MKTAVNIVFEFYDNLRKDYLFIRLGSSFPGAI